MDKQKIIDYVLDTPTNTNPRILGQMLEEYATSGGETWNTVFDGNVTTVQSQSNPYAGEDIVLSSSLTTDTAKVTFNGVEYILPKTNVGYGAVGQSGPDFTQYPCFILELEEGYSILTQTAGTYTLKIEEPQSGGSSDFSTAQVTLAIGSLSSSLGIQGVCMLERKGAEYLDFRYPVEPNTTSVITAVLYKGMGSVRIETSDTVTVEGNIQQMTSNAYMITGDCTITIS